MREIGRHLLWPLAALAILLAFNALRDPAFFHLRLVEGRLTGAMIDILNQGAPVILLALGMTLVIGTGGIDLSVGAVMAVAGAVAADQLHSGAPTAAALAAAVGAGLAAGLWNGSLIALVGLSPIVATLILMVAGRGIAQLVSNGEIIDIAPDAAILAIGRGSLLGLPVPVLMALGAAAAVAGVARLTSLGLFIECVGGNEQASRYAGLAVRSIRLAAYAIMGVLAAIAGLIDAADIAAADANNCGLYLELDAILAVVIGGAALTGGRFSIAGSLLGAIIIQTISTSILRADFGGRSVPVELNLIIKATFVLALCLVQSSEWRRWRPLRRSAAA